MSGTVPVRLGDKAEVDADLLLIGTFEGESPATAGFSESISGAATSLAERRGWRGRRGQTAEGPSAPASGCEVLGLRGLGKAADLTARDLDLWLDTTVEAAVASGSQRLALALPDHRFTRGGDAAERIQRRLLNTGYRFDNFKSGSAEAGERLGEITLLPPEGGQGDYRDTHELAQATARAVAFCRDLGNTPANHATPQWMQERAEEAAAECGLEVRTLQVPELVEKGFGGILAVGGGSAIPPRLVCLEWNGGGDRSVALVGKGITFDTGGISLKPPASMEEMKYDKCGACAALAATVAAAELKLPLRLRTYLPLAENMPDGRAYRPGDIFTAYNGKTVEVLNTDAEGRLILADALSYAAEQGPDSLVEISTLTGACVIALGLDAGGLYTPDDALCEELLAAGEASGDRLWRLPLFPEVKEELKGTHSDLKNTGQRWGASNSAAVFLSEFVGDVERWAHLDIAGPANNTRKGQGPLGATGFGVPLAVRWLARQAAG